MAFCWSLDDATVGAGFLRIFSEQLSRAISTAADEDQPPARRIHYVRRRGKRLRGLIRIVRTDFPAYKPVNAAIRDAAGTLSQSRDAKVLRDTLAELCDWSGHSAPAFAERETDEAAEADALARFHHRLIALADETADWTLSRQDGKTLARGIAEGYRAGRRAMQQCRHEPDDDEAFHDWRKQVKYFGFHLLLLRPLLPDARSQIDQAETLADLLGRHHDLAVLCAALADDPAALAPDLDAPFLMAQARLRQTRLAAHAHRLGAPLFARRPRDLRQGVLQRWHDWQSTEGKAT
jgi:hypothetical protein